MSAISNKFTYSRTTSAILEATAETPLHLLPDRERLALEPVSSGSLWGDARWVFDNATHGARDTVSTISWNLDLPDGNNLLDLHHADLLDWLRRLVWSSYAAPGDGAVGFKPGGLGSIASGLRYWVAWLVEREIFWPNEINADVIEAYQDDLQGEAAEAADTDILTESVAYVRLMPFSLLWRQRFALERAGIAAMPGAPFNRTSIFKIAKKISAVAKGSFRPIPDEVVIPVLNTAMALLGAPATDVVALAKACADAFASGMAETTGPDRRKQLAVRRQLTAGKSFRFVKVNGIAWHTPLDPTCGRRKKIGVIESQLQTYLEAHQVKWLKQIEGRPTLPIYHDNGRDFVDLRAIALELGLKAGDEQLLYRHPALHALIDAAAWNRGCSSVPLIGVTQRVRQLVLAIRSAAHLVIQATTGMRISEICGLKAGVDPTTGLPLSVMVQDSLNGLSEIFILISDLSKTEETPRAVPWVLGYRPKGSAGLPPAVQAIVILDQLLAPWRALLGTDDLFVGFRSTRGLPKARKGVSRISGDRLRESARDFLSEWVDLANLPDEAARKDYG